MVSAWKMLWSIFSRKRIEYNPNTGKYAPEKPLNLDTFYAVPGTIFYNRHYGSSVTQVNGMKNIIMQVTYFLNGFVVNMLFYCHINSERKWLLKRNLATMLPLKPKFSGKFQHFNANWCKYQKAKKHLKFQKFQLK